MKRSMTAMMPAGFFVLRTPTLPWDALLAWCGTGAEMEAEPAEPALLRQRLRQLVMRPEVNGAMYIASPGLHARLGPWLRGDDSVAALRVEPVVVRYLLRMAGRATPFGLFAGIGVGVIGPQTTLAVPPLAAQVRRTRLDMGYLFDLAERYSHDPALVQELRFGVTPTLYRTGGRLRYCAEGVAELSRRFYLVEARPTPHLEHALAVARQPNGATLSQIADSICATFADVDADSAHAYARELYDAGLLCSPLSLSVTGPDPLSRLIGQLAETRAGAASARILSSVRDDLRQLDAAGFQAGAAQYDAVAQKLAPLLGGQPRRPLFHVDSVKPDAKLALSQQLLEDIAAGLNILIGLSAPETDPLAGFVSAYVARYQEREIPLLEVLDEEAGIGFAYRPPDAANAAAVGWGRREQHLLRRLSEALAAGATVLELSVADLDAMAQDDARLPPGMAALLSIAAASPAQLASGDVTMYLQRAVGPSSSLLLGRFCGADAALAEYVGAAIAQEQSGAPEAMHAELNHLPHGPVGNVLGRPALRPYEIAIAGSAGVAPERQIALDDILVSVRQGQVYLRSARHGRRIMPHLGCAHAFQHGGLGIYRFLACLAAQGGAGDYAFSWGALASAAFLPRLVHGKWVFALARWNLPGSELGLLARLPVAARLAPVRAWRARRSLPRFVWLTEGDGTLLVDLDNLLAVDSMLHLCQHRENVSVSEVFPPPEQLLAGGTDGHFHHELIVPFVRWHCDDAAAPLPSPVEAVPRHFPGGQWLYFKLYAAPAMLERILDEVVAPLVRQMRQAGAIKRWFFVRYGDPEWHVRLRFHGDAARLWQEVAPALLAALARLPDAAHRVVLDTYEPEQGRYGGAAAMAAAEAIFEADSDAALALGAACRGDPEAGWRIALLGMEGLLSDFGLSAAQKLALLHSCRARGNADKEAAHALGRQYRAARHELEQLLTAPPPAYRPALQVLAARSQANAAAARQYQALEAAGRLSQPRIEILATILHMWVNRIFPQADTAQELMLYDFLYRHHDAQRARAAS